MTINTPASSQLFTRWHLKQIYEIVHHVQIISTKTRVVLHVVDDCRLETCFYPVRHGHVERETTRVVSSRRTGGRVELLDQAPYTNIRVIPSVVLLRVCPTINPISFSF